MSTSGPLVSVLINNYNYGRFLRDAIDSALAQTYSHVEVIVVDDGSTDDSREIIASYGGRIIPVLKENGGQASAVNAGFAHSRGELICLLDSDDVWSAGKVDRVVRAAMSKPNAVLIYHKMQRTSADLQLAGKLFPARVLEGDVSARVGKSGGWWACSPTSGLCISRISLQRLGPLPEGELRTCADAFLLGTLPYLGEVVGLRECLGLYRLHGSNNHTNRALLKRIPDAATARRQMERYERLVSLSNERLALLGFGEKLDLTKHWGYQLQRSRMRLTGHLPARRLAWQALFFAGEPAVSVRLKMFASVILRGGIEKEVKRNEGASSRGFSVEAASKRSPTSGPHD